MIYILHGDDVTSSRNYISELAGKKQSLILDGKNIPFTQIDEHLSSKSLFGDEKIVILENLLSKNKKKKEILKQIENLNSPFDIILWEDTKLTPATINLLKKAETKAFLLPQYYFQFLDSFAPGNPQKIYALYHQLLQTMTAEQIFYSLVKRLRQLLILQMGNVKESKETASMQDWQLSKLHNQLSKWRDTNLFNVFQNLQDAEIKVKSGGLPLGLSKHLDTLILSDLS